MTGTTVHWNESSIRLNKKEKHGVVPHLCGPVEDHFRALCIKKQKVKYGRMYGAQSLGLKHMYLTQDMFATYKGRILDIQ